MATFKEQPAFCSHCNKQVLARREDVPHTFWLIASVFSCGLFALIWAVLILTNNSKPFLCPICGANTGQPTNMNTLNNNHVSNNQPNIVPKKGMSTGAKVVLGIICVFFGVPFIITAIGGLANPNDSQNRTLFSAPSQSEPTPSISKSLVENKPKKVSKYKTSEERIKAGVIEMRDAEGNSRGFSLPCWRKMTDMNIFAEKKLTKSVKAAIFERCLELGGDAEQAVSEMALLFKSYK